MEQKLVKLDIKFYLFSVIVMFFCFLLGRFLFIRVPIESGRIEPSSLEMCIGDEAEVNVIATTYGGHEYYGQPPLGLESSNISIATVDDSGVIEARSAGEAEITGRALGTYAVSAEITVKERESHVANIEIKSLSSHIITDVLGPSGNPGQGIEGLDEEDELVFTRRAIGSNNCEVGECGCRWYLSYPDAEPLTVAFLDEDGNLLKDSEEKYITGEEEPFVERNPISVEVVGEGITGLFVVCNEDCEGEGTATVSNKIWLNSEPPTVTSVDIQGDHAVTLEQEQTHQLQVIATWSDGETQDVTSGGTGTTYTPSMESIASVTVNGLITGEGPGTSTVTASYQGLSDQAVVTVLAPVTSLTVAPNPVVLTAASPTQALTVNAVRSDGTEINVSNDPQTNYWRLGVSDIFQNGSTDADKNVLTYLGRGHGGIKANYPGPPDSFYAEATVCNDPPTPGNFRALTPLSPGSRFTREVIDVTAHRVRILRNEDQRRLREIILEPPRGDSIEVFAAGPDYLVTVTKWGNDSFILEGEDVWRVTTEGDDVREVEIFNTKLDIPPHEDEKDCVIHKTSYEVKDAETVSVYGSPDFQLIAVVGHRVYPTRKTFVRFYEAFDQDEVLNDTTYHELQDDGEFRANISFTQSTCSGILTWQIDNPGTSEDDSGEETIEWEPSIPPSTVPPGPLPPGP